MAELRGTLPAHRLAELVTALKRIPHAIMEITERATTAIDAVAERIYTEEFFLYLGRHVGLAVCLEGALKLKEISYIHAEAYPAGELKHGPLALVDEDMPVIAVAPNNQLLEKLKSNLEEVRARGGELFVFADTDAPVAQTGTRGAVIKVASGGNLIAPAVFTVPLQILAYHVAVLRGTDVDQPRNLAKSVTVE
jgi:glucosamine--fructose-6-phosphate aminotransferase (isomerizing)